MGRVKGGILCGLGRTLCAICFYNFSEFLFILFLFNVFLIYACTVYILSISFTLFACVIYV